MHCSAACVRSHQGWADIGLAPRYRSDVRSDIGPIRYRRGPDFTDTDVQQTPSNDPALFRDICPRVAMHPPIVHVPLGPYPDVACAQLGRQQVRSSQHLESISPSAPTRIRSDSRAFKVAMAGSPPMETGSTATDGLGDGRIEPQEPPSRR